MMKIILAGLLAFSATVSAANYASGAYGNDYTSGSNYKQTYKEDADKWGSPTYDDGYEEYNGGSNYNKNVDKNSYNNNK